MKRPAGGLLARAAHPQCAAQKGRAQPSKRDERLRLMAARLSLTLAARLMRAAQARLNAAAQARAAQGAAQGSARLRRPVSDLARQRTSRPAIRPARSVQRPLPVIDLSRWLSSDG